MEAEAVGGGEEKGVRLGREFYQRRVEEVAEGLLGKRLVRVFEKGKRFEGLICEVEAYGGEEDQASHARFGETGRNKVMYGQAGMVYMYLIYGRYWMLNIVTGKIGQPGAVLIRGTKGIEGPGRLGKELALDGSFYGEDLVESKRIWVEVGVKVEGKEIKQIKRVGVEYAGEWAEKRWRFIW